MALLWAGAAPAEGVLMLSGRSASEAYYESGLLAPDQQRIDVEALVRHTRALSPPDDALVLWYPASRRVVRLDDLTADQRVVFYCVGPDSARYQPGDGVFRPIAAGLEPIRWLTEQDGRVLWWPSTPQAEACGVAASTLQATPDPVDFGGVPLGAQAQRDMTLRSSGRVELTVGAVRVEGAGYSLIADGCSQRRLLPGESCVLQVGFAPVAAGSSTGELRAPSTATLGSERFALSGQGLSEPEPEAIFANGFE